MYFDDVFRDPQYMDMFYYAQQRERAYQKQQTEEMRKAVDAMRDLCRALKNMDEPHRADAHTACLLVMVQELGFNQAGV